MGNSYEAVIIGGGPAGLTAGIYLVRAGISTVLLEKRLVGGAAINTEHVENYPGFPEPISGSELMGRMAEQARRLGLEIKEFLEADGVVYEGGLFETRVDKEKSYRSIGIIAATGTVPAKMGIPGEDTLLGRGVSYCATCDGMFFRGLDVAVVGGGDAALSEALTLANMVGKVYLIHRRDRLRAQQALQERAAKNGRIEFLLNKAPLSINGGEQVESVTLRDTLTNEGSYLKVSGVFCYVGSQPQTDFLGPLVDRDAAGFIVTGENLETRSPGLFAAGDVRKKSLRQIATAVGDGALAAVNLEKHVLEKR
ncbi:MAG: FAD-dependent oxidoreductase [Syntrophorhabdales bacterium]|jgi:thioredoxin reductase (NADPH)